MRTRLKKTKAPKAKRSAVVVEGYLRVSADKVPGNSGSRVLAPAKMIEQIQGGLSVRELEALRDSLDVPMEKLAPKLGISNATVHRRKAQGRLRPAESERVVRLARLTGKAAKVLGGIEAAREWLKSPQFGLGGAVPLDYAETEIGAREVENLLGRIEYGVYS
jgi:putative toxin-antitoxin system antitoxin component (TIGR02293 family)